MILAMASAFLPAPSLHGEAADPVLPGDPAPRHPHGLGECVHGAKPTPSAPGRTDVLAFLDTWCLGSREALPTLSRTADAFEGRIQVVAMFAESIAQVRAFLSDDAWRRKARISVVADPEGNVRAQYLGTDAPRRGPTVVVIREGRIEWIGSPAQLEDPLRAIVQGTGDPAAWRRVEMDARREAGAGRRRVAPGTGGATEWNRVLNALDDRISAATALERIPLRVQRAEVLLQAGRAVEGYRAIEALAGEAPRTAPWLAEIILAQPDGPDRRLDVAIRLLQSAVEAPDGGQPGAWSALGRAWMLAGEPLRAAHATDRAVEGARMLGPAAEDWVAELTRVRDAQRRAASAGRPATGAPPATDGVEPPPRMVE
jgi:hypothetical protein